MRPGRHAAEHKPHESPPARVRARESPRERRRMTKRLSRRPRASLGDAVAIFESLQLYHEGTNGAFKRHPLWKLHKLDIPFDDATLKRASDELGNALR